MGYDFNKEVLESDIVRKYHDCVTRHILEIDESCVRDGLVSVLISVSAVIFCSFAAAYMFRLEYAVAGCIQVILAIWNAVLGVKAVKRWLRYKKEYREDKKKYDAVLEEREDNSNES